jgi:hypothetical protein
MKRGKYKEKIMINIMRSQDRELAALYDEVFVYGTSYKQLIIDGFTIDEINLTLRKGGLENLRLRHCIKLIRAARYENN